MTPSNATSLLKGSNVVVNSTPATWQGGKAVLVTSATTFPTNLFLQFMAADGSWINVNGAAINANGMQTLDCPAGQYRMGMSGGTAAGLTATLCACPNS